MLWKGIKDPCDSGVSKSYHVVPRRAQFACANVACEAWEFISVLPKTQYHRLMKKSPHWICCLRTSFTDFLFRQLEVPESGYGFHVPRSNNTTQSTNANARTNSVFSEQFQSLPASLLNTAMLFPLVRATVQILQEAESPLDHIIDGQACPVTVGMSPGRDIWRENSLPHRSEYEDSAIDFV
jgi:hypothetical protein